MNRDVWENRLPHAPNVAVVARDPGGGGGGIFYPELIGVILYGGIAPAIHVQVLEL